MAFSVKITIASDTRYLAPLRGLVEAAAKVVGPKRFPARAVRSCTLALIEAVDNAIFHAHRKHHQRPIDIALSVEPKAVVIKVADRGKGLNHLVVHNPKPMATHGRGLFLMRQLMTEVKSRKTPEGHAMILTYRL